MYIQNELTRTNGSRPRAAGGDSRVPRSTWVHDVSHFVVRTNPWPACHLSPWSRILSLLTNLMKGVNILVFLCQHFAKQAIYCLRAVALKSDEIFYLKIVV